MGYSKKQQLMCEHLEIFLASLSRTDRLLSSAEVEQGQRSKQMVLAGKADSVPALLDSLKAPDFVNKDACYDLLLEIGIPVKEALTSALGERGRDVDIWIIAILKQLGDDSAMERLWGMLEDANPYIRHLSALALAFQYVDAGASSEALFPVLVDALASEQKIEGTPFSVAGSALGCLTKMSGENFLSHPQAITFYNYEHFLYPPPIHPFPFAADFITTAPEDERQRIRQRAKTWLAEQTVQ